MAIESICDGCGVQLRVADEHAGKQARCPQCGNLYTVPDSNITDSNITENADSSSTDSADMTRGTADSQEESVHATWFVQTPEGQTYGPVTREILDQWTKEGRLNGQCRVRETDGATWRSAVEIYPQLTNQTPATGGSNPFRDNPASSPAVSKARSFQHPHRGVLVLVFGILGFIICPIFGLASWIMGYGDIKKMDAGTMDPEGRVMTQVGMVLGIVQTVILLLAAAGFLFMFIVAVLTGM